MEPPTLEPAHPSGEAEQEELEILLAEVGHYIRHLLQDMADSHHRRASRALDHRESHSFFLSRDRFERLREILLYLIHFCRHLPLQPDPEARLQFRHFRDHLIAHVALLHEPDVIEAAARERQASGGGADEIRPLAERTSAAIEALIGEARVPAADDWGRLFSALRLYSAFWIEINSPRIRRIRESDRFLFRLTDHLLGVISRRAAPPPG